MTPVPNDPIAQTMSNAFYTIAGVFILVLLAVMVLLAIAVVRALRERYPWDKPASDGSSSPQPSRPQPVSHLTDEQEPDPAPPPRPPAAPAAKLRRAASVADGPLRALLSRLRLK